jgi:hypothetical protein
LKSNTLYNFIRQAVVTVPDVVPMLSGRASTLAPTAYKSYEYFLSTLESMVSNVYNGFMGNEFINIMGNLVGGQLLKAYEQAWEDSGMTTWPIPDFLQASLDSFLMTQGDYIEPFYRDILTAGVDKTGLEPLLSRAELWANQYNACYNEAIRLIGVEFGQRLQWREGDTVDKCSTCLALDGLVAFAREWEELGVHPQGYPNPLLECQGGGPGNHCGCTLSPTDQRRSPNAYDTILNIVMAGKI